MPLNFSFDFKNPNYHEVFQNRVDRLCDIRKNNESIDNLSKFYKDNIAQFIIDWGVTFDPRNVERNKPSLIPFILFPKQEEWVYWFLERWKNKEPGITEKSRDLGLSWLFTAVSATICMFYKGVQVGMGSRKEEYVDKKGDPKSLFYKVRQFVYHIPSEFIPTWNITKHAPHMRIEFPDTLSIITGESGDGIGRGDRASFYFIDESAHLERPHLIEASLSQTTNCRQDVSTPKGMNNPFARKRHSGKVKVFTLHWRDDPRKDEEWYLKTCNELDDPVIIAQEIDLDYTASISGVVIPATWVQASIDAHIKLGIDPKGIRKSALDIADLGHDKNSFGGRYGILVEYLEEWSGKDGDIYDSLERAFRLCDLYGYTEIDYDADGLGAGARGDTRILNQKREKENKTKIIVNPFHGSGKVVNPTDDPFKKSDEINRSIDKGRTNQDFFENYKAQSWWALRKRFQFTYRAVVEKLPVNPDDIISISSNLSNLNKLIVELSQPLFGESKSGKMLIKKTPDGSKSPNNADTVMMLFAPSRTISRGFFSVEKFME